MTLLEELLEKRAAKKNALADLFTPKGQKSNGKPVVRDTTIRGNSGQDHTIREGGMSKNVRRREKMQEKPSETSVRRILGLFGAD